jgi:hypothetical protein
MLLKRFAICNKIENVGERKDGGEGGRCKKNIVYGLFPFSIRLHSFKIELTLCIHFYFL